jgi:hypothetical protein
MLRRHLLVVAILAATVWMAAPDAAQAADAASVACAEPAPTETAADAALESYRPINPARMVDTRDGTGGVRGAVGAGCVLRLSFAGSAVPGNAQAVALSLTAVADVGGYISVFPCASGRTDTSNLNPRGGGVATANLVVAMLDSQREVCMFSLQPTHIIVDLVGWWGPGGSRYSSIETSRVYDTRELPGRPRLGAGQIRNVPVGGVAIPADATAAVINFTVTEASNYGWALVYPCGQPKPVASTINFLPGESRAASAIVGLGGSPPGQLCVTSNVAIHFIVDVAGYYGPTPSFGPSVALHPQAGERLADSRVGIGGWTTKFAPREVRRLDPVRLSTLAGRASAVLLNVISVNGEGGGYLRVSSCGASVPTSSSINFAGPRPVSNLVAVDLTRQREVCIFAYAATDVVVDLFAVVAAPAEVLAERMSPEGIDTWPDFDVDGSDYGLVCSSGTNRFDLDLVALPLTTTRINGVPVGDGTRPITVVEDELTTVELRRGSERRTYHFRCLPDDFPLLDVDRPGEPGDGWYLTQFGQGNSRSGPYLVILDEYGAPVWYKRAEAQLLAAVRRDDGTIGANNAERFYGTPGDDVSRRTYGLDGALLDVRRPPDPANYPADHHDFVDLPNGGGAFLSYPLRRDSNGNDVQVDLSSIGLGSSEFVLDGAVVEVNQAGNRTWQWNTKDHFGDVSAFPVRWNRTKPVAGEIDLVHPNSLQRMDDGDYVLSARHYDAAFRVNRHADGSHGGGDIEWVLAGSGLPVPPGTGLRVVGDPYGGPLRPHDARLDGDVLTLFDNRTDNGRGEPARAVAYRIDARPGVMTATLLWQVRRGDGRASAAQGSARVTPDGSVLISWGQLQPVFEEFTVSGQRLMSIRQLPSGFAYRIIKYAPDAFDRATLRASAGGDLEVEAP